MSETKVCDNCYSINNYHYSSPFNSSGFCNECGSYCSTINKIKDEDLEFYERKHNEFLKQNKGKR